MSSDLAIVFPGQGSQSVGMLTDLLDTKLGQKLTEQANQRLGFDLRTFMTEGPREELDHTAHTQPALLTVSAILWSLWQQEEGPQPAFFAGHSLGEYSAHVASKTFDFSDAVWLVHQRGRFMQEAAGTEGAMAAIVGLDDALLNALCQEHAGKEVLSLANYNCPLQGVVSGHREAVLRLVAAATQKGARLAKVLPVSVPSHSALMRPAADKLKDALATLSIHSSKIPVINNVDVSVDTNKEQMISSLTRQLYSPVRWTETILALKHRGVRHIIEMGSGKVLSGLIKRIDADITVHNIDSYQGVCRVRECLNSGGEL